MSPKESTIERSRMTLSELRIDLKQKRAEAAGLRIGLVTQKDKDSARYKRVRREIAQLCFAIGQTEKSEVRSKKQEVSIEGSKASSRAEGAKNSNESIESKKSTSQTPKKSVKRSSSKKSS